MKRRLLVVIPFLCLGLSGSCFAQASIEGVVALPQTHSARVVTERYEIVSEAGVLKTDPPRAVVYLEGSFSKSQNPPVQRMTQKDLTFHPRLLPVEAGTKVEFPNLDDTYHNIFSYSPAKRFDLGRYPPDEKPTPSVLFDRAGLVTIRCDIHEHMRALILVLDTPYFTITDAQGHFRLTNLPTGHFTLKAWITSKVTREQSVDLAKGVVRHVDFP